MYVVVFNWRVVPLFFGSLASGLAIWLLLYLLTDSNEVSFFVGLAVAGGLALAIDYFSWRRRDLMGRPLWRLIDPNAGGHIFFIPFWVFGAICVLGASAGLGEMAATSKHPALQSPCIALGVAVALLPLLGDFLRPYGRFAWTASRDSEDGSDRPS